MDRLLASAPDVVLSYPETEGDRVLAPSPLLAGGSWDAGAGRRSVDRLDRANARQRVRSRSLTKTRRCWHKRHSAGGASLFKDMAACPFRAFAKHRLGARPLEDTDLGLSYRDRGTTVHKALEFIWRELGSHARLMELAAGELARSDRAQRRSRRQPAWRRHRPQTWNSAACRSCWRSGSISRKLARGLHRSRPKKNDWSRSEDCKSGRVRIAWTNCRWPRDHSRLQDRPAKIDWLGRRSSR